MAADDGKLQDLAIVDRWNGDFPVAEMALFPNTMALADRRIPAR